jgi:hypothetical protein
VKWLPGSLVANVQERAHMIALCESIICSRFEENVMRNYISLTLFVTIMTATVTAHASALGMVAEWILKYGR